MSPIQIRALLQFSLFSYFSNLEIIILIFSVKFKIQCKSSIKTLSIQAFKQEPQFPKPMMQTRLRKQDLQRFIFRLSLVRKNFEKIGVFANYLRGLRACFPKINQDFLDLAKQSLIEDLPPSTSAAQDNLYESSQNYPNMY